MDDNRQGMLDARGLACPLPVLKARRAMRDVVPGATLTVLATDPSAPEDFRSFCQVTGHMLESSLEHEGVFTIVIRRSG